MFKSNLKRNACKGLGIAMMLFSIIVMGSCQKDLPSLLETPENIQIAATGNEAGRVTVTNICFNAIANVPGCTENGGRILFGGTIERRENVTVSANGQTHITRHFTVKDLHGVGVSSNAVLSATSTCDPALLAITLSPGAVIPGSTYEVQGGAEMFNIHFTAPGQNATLNGSNTFIHEGTIVFISNTGHRVVARHVIRKVNGVVMENSWYCH
jgi:hypothetical protein